MISFVKEKFKTDDGGFFFPTKQMMGCIFMVARMTTVDWTTSDICAPTA